LALRSSSHVNFISLFQIKTVAPKLASFGRRSHAPITLVHQSFIQVYDRYYANAIAFNFLFFFPFRFWWMRNFVHQVESITKTSLLFLFFRNYCSLTKLYYWLTRLWFNLNFYIIQWDSIFLLNFHPSVVVELRGPWCNTSHTSHTSSCEPPPRPPNRSTTTTKHHKKYKNLKTLTFDKRHEPQIPKGPHSWTTKMFR
jgi:hypothetical protein